MDVLLIKPADTPDDAAQSNGSLLRELQDTLRQLLGLLQTVVLGSRSNRKEAYQWLINSIAGLKIEDAATRRRRFTQYLPGGPACRGAEHQSVGLGMMQLLFEHAPSQVGALLAQQPRLLFHFFQRDPKHVALWFGQFSMEGMHRFKHGAAALAQYALANREEMWHLLEWGGRHSQAPVAVAQRPHYFCELNVPRTVKNLMRECPGFWASPDFGRRVEEGAAQLLAMDYGFWSKELLGWLQERQPGGRAAQLYELLCQTLERGPWRQHCQRLLQLLPQRDLLPFATDLLGGSRFPAGGSGDGSANTQEAGVERAGGAWLVFRGVQWESLDRLQLMAAVGCSLPRLLRTLADGDLAGERQQAQQLVQQLLLLKQPPEQQAAGVAAHWQLRWQLRRQLQQHGSAAAAEAAGRELHELLLLHLFAVALLVQQLDCGGGDSQQQLQQLLTASGLDCQAASSKQVDPGSSHRRRSSSKDRDRKKRRRHSSKGGSSGGKKNKKKRRRRSRGRESFCSSSGSESDPSAGGGSSSDELRGEEAWGFGGSMAGSWQGEEEGQEQQPQQQMWRLQLHRGSNSVPAKEVVVSGLGLVDAVADAAAACYADWLFAGTTQ